ncbi:exo-1,3-beta-glucanase [Sticta canariensis]|nr:exo-1,3-beta-glucanase [Sticta canariensis]
MPLASNTTIPASTGAPAFTPTDTGFLRGVNIGGWLVLEKWMNGDVFTGAGADAADEFNFDSTDGAAEALDRHWSTWFTEADVQTLKSYGLNALRIPIGFWAYDNTGTPYLKGADAYLEKAIGWARSAGMKVWIDCHGQPGSQNGFDNSGHAGAVRWQQGNNLEQSVAVLTTMAQKYGSTQYADTVIGLELVNEPLPESGNNFDTTVQFAKDAYKAVRDVATNPDLMVVMHDAFRGPNSWTNTATSLGPKGAFGIDTHIYQVFSDDDKNLDQAAHISKACSRSSELSSSNAIAPTFVGEWSAATVICVYPDGTTTAGSECNVDGCQCQGDPIDSWNEQMVEQAGKYVEAQLDTFEANSSGYFFWSWGGPGPWGFKSAVEKGVIPNPVTSRKHEKQCA